MRFLSRPVALLVVMVAVLAAASTSASAAGVTINPSGNFTATGTVTIDFKEVLHDVTRPNGTTLEVTNFRGDFTFVPNDPALQTVTGHFTSGNRFHNGDEVISTVLNTQGRTTDGTKITGHILFHHTENGLGVTVVDFQKGC